MYNDSLSVPTKRSEKVLENNQNSFREVFVDSVSLILLNSPNEKHCEKNLKNILQKRNGR